jgi:cytochrome c-type biogenesis protein CcmE
MKLKVIIGVIILALFVSFLMVDLLSNASSFADFATAKKEGKTVHVIGKWVKRDIAKFDNANNYNSFYVEDSLKNVQQVHYYGTLTGDLSQADKIDIVGKYKGDVFVAEKIHLKCPSKYNEGGNAPHALPAKSS